MPQPPQPNALHDLLARLKHDLGKYVALQQRWLPDGSSQHESEKALKADLLQTRRGPNGSQDAVSVWAEFRGQLLGHAPLPDGSRVDGSTDVDVRCIDDHMETIVLVIANLGKNEPLSADQIRDGFAAADAVARACQRLNKRARSAEILWPTS